MAAAGHYDYIVDQAAFVPVGPHQVNNNLNSVVTLNPAVGAGRLLLQATNANVRYTLDGSTPSSSSGFVLRAGADPTLIILAPGVSVKVTQETSGAVIQYQWGL